MNFLSAEGLNRQSIHAVFSIFKALIFRNAQLLNEVFPSLIEALEDDKNGIWVAQGFSRLLQPDEILTKENHCVISPLHKQKTFAVLVPGITKGFRGAKPELKKNYLIALSGILRWLSYTALEPQVSSLSPLLLQTLDIEGEEDIKAGTIDTLNSILIENAKVLEEHAGSIITRLLNISSVNSVSPKIRAKALHSLAFIPAQLRMEVILPYRKQVVKKLTAALDDKRRIVRAEAVRCRSKWIELDEAGVDDD
jgi:DNA repair/transcription protein MET18/MMS19